MTWEPLASVLADVIAVASAVAVVRGLRRDKHRTRAR